MNRENLHLLIERYEQGLDITMNGEHREQMKWSATKRFRDVWFSDMVNKVGFANMFREACSECSVMINNATVSPTTGIVKAAEHDPVEVARLFNEVLFADDHGDIALRQDHLDQFVEGMNAVIKQYYPKSWKYPQDRHSASCYLSFFAPDQNFIYRYSEANLLATRIEFEQEIGAGSYFSLETYYRLCETVVEALREHPSLLENHASRLDDSYYKDNSLHLMAFDFMYCCRTYGYYKGIEYTPKQTKKVSSGAAAQAARQAEIEKQKQQAIVEARNELDELELLIAETESISLVGTQVSTKQYGDGIVVTQDENKITVQFTDVEKTFMVHSRYAVRPTFEDDAEIVAAMSKRADLLERKSKVCATLKRLGVM